MLRVIKADFEKGEYYFRSDTTFNEYRVKSFDGIEVLPYRGVPYYFEEPKDFTVRGAKNRTAAINKLKRRITICENIYYRKVREEN